MVQTFEAALSVIDQASAPIANIDKALLGLSVAAKKAQVALAETATKGAVEELPAEVSQSLTMGPQQRLWTSLHKQVKGSSEDIEELGSKVFETKARFGEFGATLSEIFPMLGGLGAIGSVAGLFELTNKFAENTEALSLASQKVGVTTDQLQKLDYAAKMTGLDTDTFNNGLMKLNKNLGAAAVGDNKKFAELLAHLHLSLKDTKGNVIDAAEALPTLEKAFAATRDPAMKAYIAMLAFGKSGQDMIPFLDQGPQKIQELTDQFAALGYTPSAADKLNAADFTDSWKKLQTAVGGFTDELGAKLSPVLTPIVNSMTSWISANKDWISSDISGAVATASTEFQAWLKSAGGVKGIGKDFKTFGGDVKTVVGDLGGMKTIGEALGVFLALKFVAQLKDAGAAVKIFGGILLDNPILATVTAIAFASLEIYNHWSDITGAIQKAIDRFHAFEKLTPKQQAQTSAHDNSRTAGFYSRHAWHANPKAILGHEHLNPRSLPNPVRDDLYQLALLRDKEGGTSKGAVQVTVTFQGAPPGTSVQSKSSGSAAPAKIVRLGHNRTISNHRND